MKTVVITGSTRGLAKALLARGCNLVACDVTVPSQAQGLWDPGAISPGAAGDIAPENKFGFEF